MAERSTKARSKKAARPAAKKTAAKPAVKKAKGKPEAKSPKKAKPRQGKHPRPSGIRRLSPHETNIHMIVYGDPGSEKTRLAGTSGERGLLLNCDGASGPDSILTSGMDVFDCDDLSDVQENVDYLKHGTHDYEWVWLDSMTLLQENQLSRVLGDVVKLKPHRDPDIPDVAEYLKVQNQLKKLVREMIGLRMNVGITAHVLRVEDEDDGAVAYWPAITGKLMPQKICGYMGIVGHMSHVRSSDEKKEEVPVLRVRRTDKIYAKDRYGAFGAGLKAPTVPRIEKAVKKAVASAASGGKE